MPDKLQEMPIQKAKSELRRRIRGLPPAALSDKEVWLGNFRRLSGEFSSLVGYMPLPDEPDCRGILEYWLGKHGIVHLPVFDAASSTYELASVGGLGGEWLVEGNYGIAEPLQDLPRSKAPHIFEGGAVWLVPGLAFSRDGGRLGRGAGYYDRLLAGTNAIKVGIAFSSRILEQIPCAEHDVRMDYLLTETGLAKVQF
ncbi:MAG: 5-formyltetrahydrofolate cyclo-ligase [Victivallales bacterium]|nr:5-formyltetrahydrofolate cyclo-ligase [Victivallales bacterium]